MEKYKFGKTHFSLESVDSFYVDKKPNIDCSRQKPIICEKN